MTLKELTSAIRSAVGRDPLLKSLTKVIEGGGGDYSTAQAFAERYGSILADKFGVCFNGYEFIPLEEAKALVSPTLENAYRVISGNASVIQHTLNQNAGIGLNAIQPDPDFFRIENLIGKLTGDELEKTRFLLGEDTMQNYSRSAVTDTIKVNASLQKEAGLKSYIERDPGYGCCEWCNSVAGRYEYGRQPENFFSIHKCCTCKILFQPSKRKWEKITYSTDKNGKLRKITETIG